MRLICIDMTRSILNFVQPVFWHSSCVGFRRVFFLMPRALLCPLAPLVHTTISLCTDAHVLHDAWLLEMWTMAY